MINKTFTNPFLWTDIPDLDVIRVNDTYYMTSTTMYFNPGCPIMKSKDLVNWEIVNYVYDTLSDCDHMTLKNGKHDYGKGTWASTIRYHNGTFYVAFVAYNTNTTYIFQTEDIESGPWRRYEIKGIYHDMSILFDQDKVYMVYGVGEIKVIELTSDARAIKPGGMNKTIIKHADPSETNSLAEGAHIYKINDKYYIFIIAWPRVGKKRRIQVCFRADSIDGNYEHKIVLDDDIGFNNAGVAQGGIVDTPDGEWYAHLFQDHGAVGRIPVILPVHWQDGWPIFGDNGKVPEVMPYPLPPQKTQPLLTSDEFDTLTLPLQWQWNHNPDNFNWSLSSNCLRLTTGRIVDHLFAAPNTLTQRTFGPCCEGSVMIDISNMKNGDYAGLAALQDYYGFVGVKQVNGEKFIVMETHINKEKAIPIKQDCIYLKIAFDFVDAKDEAYFYYSLCGKEWTRIGSTLKMEYLLTHFTGYRFALFNYATENIGGFVTFNWFRVSIHAEFVPI